MSQEFGAPWTDSGVNGLWLARGVRNQPRWDRLAAERQANRLLCAAWRDAALADGWTIRPTYTHEPQEDAFTLERDGFKILGLCRPVYDDQGFLNFPNLNIWGPDGASILTPLEYDWNAILAGVRRCGGCGATNVETRRYAFSSRRCTTCAKIPLPSNWCD